SSTDDYCDQCGSKIAGAPTAGPPAPQHTEVLPALTAVATRALAAAEPCPACGEGRAAGAGFCESCGYDFGGVSLGAPPAPSEAGTAVLTADLDQFEQFAPDGITFPTDFTPLTIPLSEELQIGRDTLGGDPAVSRVHAVLRRQPDGSYSIVDQGSTNGTRINDDPAPVPANEPVVLDDGDCIRLGAWTVITLHRSGGRDA